MIIVIASVYGIPSLYSEQAWQSRMEWIKGVIARSEVTWQSRKIEYIYRHEWREAISLK